MILTSQVSLSHPPEEELERLTKKLVYDMSHPPNGEYFGELNQGGWKGWEAGVRGTVDLASWAMQVDCPFLSPGRCGGCGEDVVGDGAGVVALDRIFHVGCFVCSTCRAQLRGQHFYAVDRRAYCESCYVVSGWGWAVESAEEADGFHPRWELDVQVPKSWGTKTDT